MNGQRIISDRWISDQWANPMDQCEQGSALRFRRKRTTRRL